MGATLDEGLEEQTYGPTITLAPMGYDTALQRAHRRTFNLQQRLHKAEIVPTPDADVEVALKMEKQPEMFGEREAS